MWKLTCCRRLNRDTVSKCLFAQYTFGWQTERKSDSESEEARASERERNTGRIYENVNGFDMRNVWPLLLPFACSEYERQKMRKKTLAEKVVKHFDTQHNTHFAALLDSICCCFFRSFIVLEFCMSFGAYTSIYVFSCKLCEWQHTKNIKLELLKKKYICAV